ncbi:MAG: Fe-Mn family superoxide dismutase [Polaromonas sp.]|nr:Fe-Mn family superoxide dismutase [Polaromonas sp.]
MRPSKHCFSTRARFLALNMYEHAHARYHGAADGAYVDAFMDHIDWAPVYERYQHAVHGASESFGANSVARIANLQVGGHRQSG